MPRQGAVKRLPKVPDIRRGDEVIVLAGKDAGKRGAVERVERNARGFEKIAGTKTTSERWKRVSPRVAATVVVAGLNIAKRHTKPSSKQGRSDRAPRIQQGGILEIARPMNVSNVMIICPSCSRPTRIRHEHPESGKSVRVCAHCGQPVAREAKA
ncbi:MAG: 50S ribosomal protein L24 [Candidatus Limnocylindrales bacterium]